jgi:hypothetical protein
MSKSIRDITYREDLGSRQVWKQIISCGQWVMLSTQGLVQGFRINADPECSVAFSDYQQCGYPVGRLITSFNDLQEFQSLQSRNQFLLQ